MASRAAGGCFLAALGTGAVVVLIAAAPDAGRLILWGIGALVLWWAIRRVPRTPDPAPPAPPEGAADTKPQLNIVQAPDNPNRWHVLKETP